MGRVGGGRGKGKVAWQDGCVGEGQGGGGGCERPCVWGGGGEARERGVQGGKEGMAQGRGGGKFREETRLDNDLQAGGMRGRWYKTVVCGAGVRGREEGEL